MFLTIVSPLVPKLTEFALINSFVATAGEKGRKALMKEIELGKRLAESSHINVVKFIGCVTTQSKTPHSLSLSTRYLVFFFSFSFNILLR